MLDLEALFEKHEDEYIRFERETNPKHPRPDVFGASKRRHHDVLTADMTHLVAPLDHVDGFYHARPSNP